jgi:hypothetical protein
MLKSFGKNSVTESLADIITQAQEQGGEKAQDPDARAFSAAKQLGGNVMDSLQTLGKGGVLDDKIRELQALGEKKGFSPEVRQAINEARKFQSGAALDARAMGKVNFNKGGGGGGGYSSGGRSMAGSDSLASIAEMLAKAKGNLRYNSSLNAVGMDRNYNRALISEDEELINQLQPIYDQLMNQMKGASEPRMAEQVQQTESPVVQDGNFFAQEMRRKRDERKSGDPYRSVREQTLAAALRGVRKF